jgi:predicted nucleic acid-binding protein
VRIDFLADTNILINLLEGDKRLIPYTEKLLAVSFIREMELLGKPGITSAQIKACKALLNDTMLIPYSDEIKEITIQLKQKKKITLPDAMIAVTGL